MTKTVLGTCHHDCPDSCGWIATVEGDAVTKLRGNPAHPYSKGELCPKVNRLLDRVYSPERLLYPLLRTGAKGAGEFRRVSWDEALTTVASRLQTIIESSGGEAIYPWSDAGTQGLLNMSSLDRRFFAHLGASRSEGALCGQVARVGVASTNGTGRAADPANLRYAKLVLLWATNTRLTNRHLWPFVEEARANGARIVVIDSLRTVTAESADWFIQPLPGTDVALMLAMMHVLIRDDLIDHDYVAKHTYGYEQLAERVSDWTPARAATVCGIAADDVEALATAYGKTTPAFIRTLIGAEHHEGGAMFFRTLTCLPALTGSWKHRGGGLARSVGSYTDTNVDDTVFEPDVAPATRRINMNHLGRALTALDPPIEALFVWNGNPLVTVPNAELTRKGLLRDDLFTVVSEQFMTDTARYADVIFPAATQLEQLDVVPAWGHLYLGWNEPAMAPRGECVPNVELWRRLARAIGITDPLFDLGDDQLIDFALHGVDKTSLQRDGFVRLSLDDDLRPFASGGFETATGRAEFYAAGLASIGADPLPSYRPAREAASVEYPLALLTPKVHTRFLNSSYAQLPRHGGLEEGPWVELSAADAAARGVGDGDQVRVFNGRGSLTLRAVIGARVRDGVVAVPFGWWDRDHGGQGSANSLTSDELTDWGGGVAFNSSRVEVERVTDGEVG